jgi:cell fate (sporulation/competence/biofilm development) regulator YmcA (YheA/YmcA/DUF963 family)
VIWLSNIDKLQNYISNLDETKRFKELENYIKNNKKIKKLYDDMLLKQKQLVNAKEFNQKEQAKIYEEEYNKLQQELLDMPFVEEFLELVDILNSKLNIISSELEDKLEKIIND